MAPKGRFAFIDAWRGIASLGVVFYHAIEGHHIDSLPSWVREAASVGRFGVPVFFVISGFVIAHSLSDERMTFDRLWRFVLKRSIRLDPPYWAAIAIAIVFSVAASSVVKGREPEVFTLPQIVAHLAYLQTILGFKNINPVFWTLCYEVQFYLAFALLLFFNARWSIAIAAMVSLLWCYRAAPDIPGLFPSLWYAFLLGAVARFAWRHRAARPAFYAYLFFVIVSAILYRDQFAMACCASVVMFYAAAVTENLETLDWRWLQGLGAISYSLYLLHNPITGAVFRVGSIFSGHSIASEEVWWIVSIAACIVGSTALYLIVERPCSVFAKRIPWRRAGMPVAIAQEQA